MYSKFVLPNSLFGQMLSFTYLQLLGHLVQQNEEVMKIYFNRFSQKCASLLLKPIIVIDLVCVLELLYKPC